MSESSHKPQELTSESAKNPGSQRLESWKEIAAYLKRDVRTVQRWEKQEGLPVYRHMHSERGTVYGYKPELDAWWNNRRPRLEAQEPVPARWRPRRWWLVPAAAAVVALAAAILWWPSPSPPVAFRQRDWVFITNFENLTGEPLFNGTLEYALERELSNSQFVSVVPRERVQDALRLMKRPPDTPVDSALGRELCLRDGNIRVMLAGRIEKLGSTYLLSGLLVDPASGTILHSASQQAVGQEAVLAAVQRLSDQIRSTLGEERPPIPEGRQPLEKVTTPSLRALQLYSQAMAFMYQQTGQQAAAELLEQALSLDPDFASAHILLAHAYSNLGQPRQAAPHYQKAFALADSTTDRERYFILGSYYDRFSWDEEKAAQAYKVLVGLYPDDYWGVHNLAFLYSRTSREEQAVPYIVRRAELRPNSFISAYRAWEVLTRLRRDSPNAGRFLERAQGLSSSDEAQAYPEELAELVALKLVDYLRRQQLPQALAETERLAHEIDSYNPPLRPWLAGNVGWGYMQLGKLHLAEKYARRSSFAHLRLARLADIRGDRKAFRYHMRHVYESGEGGGPVIAARLARAGLLTESEKLVAAFASHDRQGYNQLPLGELALTRGETSRAVSSLRKAVEAFKPALDDRFLLSAEALARALEQEGDAAGAIQVLEQALQGKPEPAALSSITSLQYRLLRLYRASGREGDAQDLETELRKMLAYADPDHPILVELDKSSHFSLR